MMRELFMAILNMSLSAVFTAVMVVMLRLLVAKRIPWRYTALLWTAVFVRLALPSFFTSGFSLFGLISKPGQAGLPGPGAVPGSPQVKVTSEIFSLASMDYFPDGVSGVYPIMERAVETAALVWAVAAVALLAFFTVLYLRACLEFRTAVRFPSGRLPADIAGKLRLGRVPRVYSSAQVESPLVCGMLRPKVILSTGLLSEEASTLEMVLTHEFAHIRRGDCILKPVMLALACLHWFNPAIWYCYFVAVQDMERACDERVLRTGGRDIRAAYAKILCELSAKDRRLGSLGIPAFGESSVKKRVVSIVAYKGASRRIAVVSALLVGAVLLCMLFNPIPSVSGFSFDAPSLINERLPGERQWISYEELPEELILAVVTREDKSFWEHNGVDWRRITGAALNMVLPVSSGPSSTITQQLVRNVSVQKYFSLEGKAKEIQEALRMEQYYSKYEILEAYLNQIYYGNNIYGVGDAAEFYFGRPLAELSREELASLAVIPQEPGRLEPLHNPENNRVARDALLAEMSAS